VPCCDPNVPVEVANHDRNYGFQKDDNSIYAYLYAAAIFKLS
jgi:hypothetical protein